MKTTSKSKLYDDLYDDLYKDLCKDLYKDLHENKGISTEQSRFNEILLMQRLIKEEEYCLFKNDDMEIKMISKSFKIIEKIILHINELLVDLSDKKVSRRLG